LLNLGHVAFFGIGAYAAAILSTHGFPWWVGLTAGVILAAVAGVLLALPTARLKGDYLALATLGFTFILGAVARNWQSLTRGALGIPGIPRLASSNNEFLVIALVVAVIVAVLVGWIVKSSFGRVLQAIRDDELAAASLGKNVFAYRTAALAISAALAGLAGGLSAHFITFIDPSVFSLDELILLFSMVIVGGLASIRGSIAGAVIIFLLPEPLRFIGFPSSVIGPMRAILYAVILLLILVYRPKGLFGRVDLA
jgi:branched-chain amino acid transport system permease protein